MRPHIHLLAIAALGVAALACGAAPTDAPAQAEAQQPPASACAYANDGACDEPWLCKAGTDEADCARACESGVLAPDHLACTSRAKPAAPPATPPEYGSHGTSGPIGTWDGAIEARGEKQGTTIDRYFRVHVPELYDPSKPTPVVYMLSGFTVNMYVLESYTELDRTADLNDFIVVYPSPQFRDFGPGIGWVFAWHVYTAEWTPGTWQENPDLDFIRKLTAKLKALYNVDRTRIFTTGHSRGAGLSIMLSFLAPELIAGFASEMGFADVNKFDAFIKAYAGRHMPGVLVHGTADGDVPVASSDAISKTLTGAGWVKDVDFLYLRLPDVVHQWQPQYNEVFWQFLRARPLPIEQAAP